MNGTITCPLCSKETESFGSVPNRTMTVIDCAQCGRFRFSANGRRTIEHEITDAQRRLLRGATRAARGGDSVPEFTSAAVYDTLTSLSFSRNPSEIADRVLALVAARTKTFSTSIKLPHDVALDLFLPADNDLLLFLQELEAQGLVKSGQLSPVWTGHVTFKGWQRLRQLESTVPRGNRAFVAMSFNPDLKAAWTDGIKLALEATGYTPVRVDEVEHIGKIDDRIVAELQHASLVIADFTEHRPGVYFEAGFAMGRQVPVIWLCRAGDVDKAHFDTRQYNHLVWESPQELRVKLETRIRAVAPLTAHSVTDA